MKLLVTGCTGFIGLHLTRMLLAEGHEVVGLVRDPAKLPADLASRIETLRGDLGLFRQKDLVLPRVDVVVHLAAVIAAKDEAEYAAVNFQAVEDLLAALRRQAWSPRRFVFASSLAAAGPNRKEGRHSEDDDTAPIDPYGIAKRDAEQLMRAQPFPTTSFRPPVVLGAGDPASLTLYKMARSGLAFLPAGAAQRLSFVGVHDLCRAIVAIVSDSSDKHRIYYTTSETEITNRELLQSIARAMKPNSTLRIVPVPHALLRAAMHVSSAAAKLLPFKNQLDRKQLEQMLAPSFVCTSARLSADTGWVAKESLDEITAAAVAGYRTLGWL